MKMKNTVLSIIIAVSALLGAGLITSAKAQASSTSTLKSVLDHYLSIQSTLARDSTENVSASAKTLAAVVRSDETKSVPAAIAEQAETLAKARNIAGARKAFKPLSEALIAYLKVNAAPPGTYYEVYCPIVKASWLQAGETVKNPYLGLRSATATWGWACAGVVKAKYESPSSSKD
jgi:Cu(I)/Ag(I) efflux system membrane fusion protein